MGCSAVVVNHPKTNTHQFAAHALDPNPQKRSEGYCVGTERARCVSTRKSLPRLWENHKGRAKPLCQLCSYARHPAPCECRAVGARNRAQSRSSCETGRIRASPSEGTCMLGCVQPAHLAHHRTIFTKN